MKHGGRAIQLARLREPTAYDDETTEMLSWFAVAARKRDFKVETIGELSTGNGAAPA